MQTGTTEMYTVYYKNPRIRKLRYVHYQTREDARKAPKEIHIKNKLYLMYGRNF